MEFLDFLMNFGQVALGLCLYFVYKARNYIINGAWKWHKWKDENMAVSIYSLILALLITVTLSISPDAVELFKFIGLNVPTGDIDGNMSFLMLGAGLAAITRGVNQTEIKKEKIE